MAGRPTGTVTFAFTDVVGSTRLWEADPSAMQAALARHDEIIRSSFERHGGFVFSTAGDAFAAAFSTPADALAACTRAAADLEAEPWPAGAPIRVRMGVHTGAAEERDGDYFGPPLNRGARLMASAHGGQILVSDVTAQLLGGTGPRGAGMVDLGAHRLKDLAAPERIWQVGGRSHPPLRTLDGTLHNLPVPRSELFGREADIVEVAALLRAERLVSLVGIGGTGKTRLAIAVAAEVIEEFPDGVWFVDLVPVTDGRRLVEVIADVAGLSLAGTGDPSDQLSTLLAHRQVLLVLDNCEHLVDPVAELVDTLLDETRQARFMVTSREPLELPDEHQVHVTPLAVGDDLYSPGVALLATAAAHVGVSLGPDDVDTAAGVCRALDGLPLALELAGAQLRHLGLAELLGRLDRRFELLEREGRGRHRRQANLRGVLQDTWDLLDEQDRELLCQVAAFPKSFDVDAVEGVADDIGAGTISRGVGRLVDRSLIVSDGSGRLHLLETVKLFARQQWPPSAPYLDRHADWCLRYLRSYPYEARHTSFRMAGWASRHYDDLRAAEDHLVAEGRTADVVDLLCLQGYAFMAGTGVRSLAVIERIERYLSVLVLDPIQAAVLRLMAANAAVATRRHDVVETFSVMAVDALRAGGRAEDLAMALTAASFIPALRDPPLALATLDEALVVADAVGATSVANTVRSYRASHLAIAGRLEEAKAALSELEGRLGAEYDAVRNNHDCMTAATWIVDKPERSVAALSSLHHAYDLAGFPYTIFRMFGAIAVASTGDASRTWSLVEAALAYARRSGEAPLPDILLAPAFLAWRRGEVERARRWLTAIRHAGRSTANFQPTVMFRQLRAVIGLDGTNPLETASLEQLWAEALEWLTSAAVEDRGGSATRSTDSSTAKNPLI